MVAYLFGGGRDQGERVGVGKTMVSSSMIDRVTTDLGRRLDESRSGSSGSWTGCWTAPSASAARRAPSASFLRRDGTVWTTDKDGIVCCLLAAEMTARRGADPSAQYRNSPPASATRLPARSTPRRRPCSTAAVAGDVQASELTGEPITAVLTSAPSNGAALGESR